MNWRSWKFSSEEIWIFLLTSGLLLVFGIFNASNGDYSTCDLCDGKQYLKVYWLFERGLIEQIKYPYYTRPFVPFLASLIPGDNPKAGFYVINITFIFLSVFATNRLWAYLNIPVHLKYIGLGWMLIHWTGIIRYNLFDYATVDVPVYFFQALTLLLFFQKKHRWFYIILPLATLQKESILVIAFLLLILHVFKEKKQWFSDGKHLLFAIFLAIAIQKMVVWLLPDQIDQRSGLQAILWHGHWALEDPTRFIRWFAAFGSAYGIVPFIILFNFNNEYWLDHRIRTLVTLSSLYCAFGILAGEDMTRILFLGFPYLFTLSLLVFQQHKKWLVGIALALSLISLRVINLRIDLQWAVDYREMEYVYRWAIYYLTAVGVFSIAYLYHIRHYKKISD